MAKVEVDEAALASQAAVIDIVAAIERNPKMRSAFLKMVKEVKPDLSIPEVDAAAPVQAEISEMRKEMREFLDAQKKAQEDAETARQEAAFANSWNKQKNSLRDLGWLEEGITAVEEFAKSEGIANLEAAAALYEKRNPAPAPAYGVQSGAFDFFTTDKESDDGKYFESLFKSKGDNAGAEAARISSVINDVRRANRR